MISRPNFGPLRWHYPDQVVRVFLSLHKEGHPESLKQLIVPAFAVVNQDIREGRGSKGAVAAGTRPPPG